MSAHEFFFPPPPPPPPLATPNYAPNGQNPSFGGRGNRGNRGFRGRGQSGERRGFRAGHNESLGAPVYQRNDSHISNPSSHPTHRGNHGNGYPLPNYPPVQQHQYAESPQIGYGQQPSNYPPAVVTPAPSRTYYGAPQRPQYYDGNSHNAGYSHNSPSYNVSYPHEPYKYDARPSRPSNPAQPLTAGPPIRMGFDTNQPSGYQQTAFQNNPQQLQSRPNPYSQNVRIDTRSPLQQNPAISFHSSRRDSPNPYHGNRNRGQKRGHQDAFGEARQSTLKANSKTQVAPAVPSFGIPLPVKPPTPETIRRPRKKKRRYNQLGLTPKSLEHESSEEDENDIDEEAKHATASSLPSSGQQQLKFTYKGQTSVLKSANEIDVWIAERKKRFPTKARLEEKKKQLREMREIHRAAKQDREATANLNAEAKERQKAEAKIDAKAKRKEEAKAKRKGHAKERPVDEAKVKPITQVAVDKKETTAASDSVASKAKLKMEKLRKLLEKEEKRVARAEAKVARLKAEANDHAASTEQSPSKEIEKTKRSEGVEIEKGLKDEPPADGKLETMNAIKANEDTLVKNENVDMSQSKNMDVAKDDIEQVDSEDKTLDVSSEVLDPLTPTSQPSQSELSLITIEQLPQTANMSLSIEHNSRGLTNPFGLETDASPISSGDSISSSYSSSISMSTDSEEDTSSDDSSSSASSSSAPESRPSKRTQPEKVAPPKRSKTKTICRNFLQSGRCKAGSRCRFRHELPERGNLAKVQRKQQKQARRDGKRQRVGLYQRLVEQEKQREQAEAKAAEQQQEHLPTQSIKKEDATQV